MSAVQGGQRYVSDTYSCCPHCQGGLALPVLRQARGSQHRSGHHGYPQGNAGGSETGGSVCGWKSFRKGEISVYKMVAFEGGWDKAGICCAVRQQFAFGRKNQSQLPSHAALPFALRIVSFGFSLACPGPNPAGTRRRRFAAPHLRGPGDGGGGAGSPGVPPPASHHRAPRRPGPGWAGTPRDGDRGSGRGGPGSPPSRRCLRRVLGATSPPPPPPPAA